MAFVGYGIDGGTRAVEDLRAIVCELGMAAVGPQVAISLRADYADGRLEPRSFQAEARRRMLDQLGGWSAALRALRRRTASREGHSRPELDDRSASAAGAGAVEQLVAGLQDGIDHSSADLASWILTDPDNLGDDEKGKLARARERCPHLDALANYVTGFAKILTGLHGDRLDDWITAVEAGDQPDLHSFARGLKHDHQAVLNGLTMPWSSGVVEGNANRLILWNAPSSQSTESVLLGNPRRCGQPAANSVFHTRIPRNS